MVNGRLSHIELFAFDHEPSTDRHLRPGSLYLLLKLTCGECACYGQCVILPDDGVFDLTKWGAYLRCIRHSTAQEILQTVTLQEHEWTTGQRVLLHSALSALLQDTNTAAALPLSVLFGESVSYYSILT
ncbi:hypothetical protein C2I18_03445 [Paenibacillus sp. PK3_47]|uniref:hypothetical protein n=1 Tax=Paenibacillus sp. PK3_47 TaxID=2072642 RepID=UPI00201D9D7E|nr:hypothetical protein [Paenibacillus sp. PK3_47]UQZ32695.1 hypothetical protein C2I18_03445 [Paenibacillus sp. PK3_47]